MANVDPFVIQWPDKWINDPEIAPVITYLNRFLHDLFIRSGGGEDLLDSTEQALTSSGSRISRNGAKIDALEDIGFEVEIITEDFTTFRNQIIICKNSSSIEVTLDPGALTEDRVHIKRANAELDVIGVIDGLADRTINEPLFSLHLVFNGTDWSQI